MFYPIPSLGGKYEIDENGVVRNAKSKRIHSIIGNSYSLKKCSKSVTISKRRLMVEVFGNPDEFLPIPSLDGRYEVNKNGVVRNVKSKKIIKHTIKQKRKVPLIYIEVTEKQRGGRSLQQIMWEVWGQLPKNPSLIDKAMSVQIQRYGEYYIFNSFRKCAAFLAQKSKYAFSTIKNFLNQRTDKIDEWQIFYK